MRLIRRAVFVIVALFIMVIVAALASVGLQP